MDQNPTVTQDTNMDLESMMFNGENTNPADTFEEAEQPEAKETRSALAQAFSAKKESNSGGIEIDEEDEENISASPLDNGEVKDTIDKILREGDENALKAKAVVVVREPKDQNEYTQMMFEVSQVELTEEGTAIVPEGAQFIIPKTPEVVAKMQELKEGDGANASENDQNETVNSNGNLQKPDKKETIVKVLIDKTGLGANIEFDQEEAAVITKATEIHLVEVEDMELKTIEVDRAVDGVSLLKSIDTYQLSISKVPMTFPASGFKADMAGLSWGEFSDITFDISDDSMDYLNYDKIRKRMSIIYNKMINLSCGAFADFDDFLRKFAYIDIPYAVYGLLIATQPEKDTIGLVCNRNSCKKRFNHTYSPRSVIDLDTAKLSLLERIEKISTATGNDRESLFKNSRVNKFMRFTLPQCKYVVDLGIASCYDYLNGIIQTINKYDEMISSKEMQPDDSRLEAVQMLQGVRAIHIPQKDGGFAHITDPDGLIQVITTAIPPTDGEILNVAYDHYVAENVMEFSLKNVTCPHCGNHVKRIPIQVDDLVFLIRQHQKGTRIAFDSFQNF